MPETVDVKVMSDDEFLKNYKDTFKKERYQFKNYCKDASRNITVCYRNFILFR